MQEHGRLDGLEGPRRERRDEIGFYVHRLHTLCKRLVDEEAFQDVAEKPTRMQSWIIGYLYENRNRDVYQKDVQAHFSVRRSTVTGILQLMEKNGWITRISVEGDARLKKLGLTPQAIELHERIEESIQRAEQQLSKGLTPGEKQLFLELCQRIAQNAQEGVR